MRVDFALIAQHAQLTPEGLFTVLGGGIDTYWATSVPTPFQGVLFTKLMANQAEAARPHELEIQCNDEDGHPILPMPIRIQVQLVIPPMLPVGWEVPALAVGSFTGMPLNRAGRYSFELLLDGQWAKSVPFRVIIGQPPWQQPPGQAPVGPPAT